MIPPGTGPAGTDGGAPPIAPVRALHRATAWLLVAAASGVALAQSAEPVRATEQLVVSANPHASEAGRKILRQGGGAIDAAIAVQLVLTLVEPQSSGVGGGAFMLFYDAPERRGTAQNGSHGARSLPHERYLTVRPGVV